MTLESKLDLQEETIDKLQTLICYNIDSYDGYMSCAGKVESPHLANLFRDLAHQRSAMAAELQNFVAWNHEQADHDGSIKGAIHRLWIEVRDIVIDWNPPAILAEAERGEGYLKQAYEDALKAIPGSALNDMLHQHYARVKSAHDRVRDLREQYQGKN